MVASLKASEVNAQNDPSVAKQYDTTTPMHDQFNDFYALADSVQACLLTTHRPGGVGLVSRSMAVARRSGPDFLFLANLHSSKFADLEHSKEVGISFMGKDQIDWASVSGIATVVSNSDPRIKELWSRGTKAWFGDLGNGINNGSPEDPRMALIEVRARKIVHYKSTVSALGFMKEIAVSTVTGGVAQTGVLRDMSEAEIEKARAMA